MTGIERIVGEVELRLKDSKPEETLLWASYSFCADKHPIYNLLVRGIVGQEPELTSFECKFCKVGVKVYSPREKGTMVVTTSHLVIAEKLLEKAGLFVLDPLFVSCEGYEGCSKNEAIPENLRGKQKYTALLHFAENASQRGLVAIDPCGDTLDAWLTNYLTKLGVVIPVPEKSIYGGKSERGFPAVDTMAVEEVAKTIIKILENGATS